MPCTPSGSLEFFFFSLSLCEVATKEATSGHARCMARDAVAAHGRVDSRVLSVFVKRSIWRFGLIADPLDQFAFPRAPWLCLEGAHVPSCPALLMVLSPECSSL